MLTSELSWCFRLLDAKQLREYWVVVTLSTFSALMEMVGIASIIPVITVLVGREKALTSDHIVWIYRTLGEPEPRLFLIALTITAIAIVWSSSLITMLSVFANRRFLNGITADISTRVYRRYMAHPIEDFYARPSSEFLRNVNGVSERVSTGAIGSSIVLISRLLQLTLIVLLLLAVNPLVTLILVLVILGSYLAVYFGIRQRLSQMTARTFAEARVLQQLIVGSYQAYRSISIDRRLPSFVGHFRELKRAATRTAANIEIIGSLPRQLIEMIGITMLLVASFLVGRASHTNQQFISVMALFGVAAYRILPSAQQVYQAINRITVALVICNKVSSHWGDLREPETPLSSRIQLVGRPRFLAVDRVSYSHGRSPLFFELSTGIHLSGLIRIAGPSGIGKTTFAELLTGLRAPQSGQILLDGIPLTRIDLSSWWSRISYLSQGDYLFEGSLRENVAMGHDQVDEDRLRLVAEICDFDALPSGHASGKEISISEGGVNFSGGQRARVLLARAIYKRSDVLFLDEAFAALDVEAARAIIERFQAAFPDRCVVIISHREAELPSVAKTIRLSSPMGQG